jgi:hypothetical protein
MASNRARNSSSTGRANATGKNKRPAHRFDLRTLRRHFEHTLRGARAQPLEQAPEGTLAHYGLDLGAQLSP